MGQISGLTIGALADIEYLRRVGGDIITGVPLGGVGTDGEISLYKPLDQTITVAGFADSEGWELAALPTFQLRSLTAAWGELRRSRRKGASVGA